MDSANRPVAGVGQALVALRNSIEAKVTQELRSVSLRLDAIESRNSDLPGEMQRLRDVLDQRLNLIATQFENRIAELEREVSEGKKKRVMRIERDSNENMSRVVEE